MKSKKKPRSNRVASDDGLERGVNITITGCDKCPNLKTERHYTADSFENVTKWMCSAKDKKQISLMDWNDKPPKIPSWCPLRSNK